MAERSSKDDAADTPANHLRQTVRSGSQSLQEEGTDLPENFHIDESPDTPDTRNARTDANDEEGRNAAQNSGTDGNRNASSQRTWELSDIQVCQDTVDGATGGNGQQLDLPRSVQNITATSTEDASVEEVGHIYWEAAEMNNNQNAYAHYPEMINLADQPRFLFPSESYEDSDDEQNLPS